MCQQTIQLYNEPHQLQHRQASPSLVYKIVHPSMRSADDINTVSLLIVYATSN